MLPTHLPLNLMGGGTISAVFGMSQLAIPLMFFVGPISTTPSAVMMFTLALEMLKTQVRSCVIPCSLGSPLRFLRLALLLLARSEEIVNQSSLARPIHIALKMGAAVLLLTISLLPETLESLSFPFAFFFLTFSNG